MQFVTYPLQDDIQFRIWHDISLLKEKKAIEEYLQGQVLNARLIE